MTVRFSEAPPPETFAPGRTLRAVIYPTDRFRLWVEDPQHERWSSLEVPDAVGEVLDTAHVRLFHDVASCIAWADEDGVTHITFKLL